MQPKGLNQLAQEIHQNAKNKGFFDEPKNIGEMIALIHSEASEALEADRKDRYMLSENSIKAVNGWTSDVDFIAHYEKNVKGTFEEEIADMIIRPLDLAAFKNIDADDHVKAKMRYNSLRPHKHGKKY